VRLGLWGSMERGGGGEHPAPWRMQEAVAVAWCRVPALYAGETWTVGA
jgi:hypothetical protein